MARGLVGGLNRLRGRPVDPDLDRVRGFVHQLRAARLGPGNAAAATGYAALNWLLDALCLWLCFHAVGGDAIGVAELLLAYCAGWAMWLVLRRRGRARDDAGSGGNTGAGPVVGGRVRVPAPGRRERGREGTPPENPRIGVG